MRSSTFIAALLCAFTASTVSDAKSKVSSRNGCSRCTGKSHMRARLGDFPARGLESAFTLSVKANAVPYRIDDRFLSVTIDTVEMKRHWKCLPLHSEKLLLLASGLSPAFLRVGGTDQDFLTFLQKEDGELERPFTDEMPNRVVLNSRLRRSYDLSQRTGVDCTPNFSSFSYKEEFNVSFALFDAIADFAERVGWRFIFGLNARKRNPDGSWDARNAKLLIEHALSKNYEVAWELGNEPNRYGKYAANKILVSPEQMAEDFHKLRMVTMGRASIYGPDTNKPKYGPLEYLHRFLLGEPHVNAVTYHHYYIHQSEARLQDYLSPVLLDRLVDQLKSVLRVTGNANVTVPIWLGETGSSSGGGANGLSNTYVAGFLYLDKLGLAAKYGHQVVLRQSFYGGYYGLLDPLTHNPLPDYWSAFLFKALVGRTVLDVAGHGEFFRVYAFCGKSKADVVMMALNLNRGNITFHLDEEFDGKSVTQYLLSPPNGDLQSKHVLLNGKLLQLVNDIQFPVMSGEAVQQPVVMPPLTYGFYVIHDAMQRACM